MDQENSYKIPQDSLNELVKARLGELEFEKLMYQATASSMLEELMKAKAAQEVVDTTNNIEAS